MSNIENLSFEQAIKELELTVKTLESGDSSLDDSIKLFEKGIALSKLCYDKIDGAKLKIEKLSFSNGEPNSNE